MSYQLLKLVLIVLYAITNIQSQCPKATTLQECIQANPTSDILVPLFHGRCCLQNERCIYVENPTPGKIVQQDLKCGTGIEMCNAKPDIAQKDYQECYKTQVELPYKCCYIGYRYSRKCVALDVSKKQIYSVFEAQFRAIYGLSSEDKLEIECGSSIIKSITGLFISLIFVLLL